MSGSAKVMLGGSGYDCYSYAYNTFGVLTWLQDENLITYFSVSEEPSHVGFDTKHVATPIKLIRTESIYVIDSWNGYYVASRKEFMEYIRQNMFRYDGY